MEKLKNAIGERCVVIAVLIPLQLPPKHVNGVFFYFMRCFKRKR